jgi:hypothetical protein
VHRRHDLTFSRDIAGMGDPEGAARHAGEALKDEV